MHLQKERKLILQSHSFLLLFFSSTMDFESFVHSFQAQSSQQLEEILERIAPFSIEAQTKQEQVINKLKEVLTIWATSVVYQYSLNDKEVFNKDHLRLFPFGSRKYGDCSSDIDILCLSSFYITRENFFSGLQRLFGSMKEVSELVMVNAFIPVIKMKFCGVPVDLLFAETQYRSLPHGLVPDEHMKKKLDARSFASIGGYRTTRKMLSLVPDLVQFSFCLKVVKTWARKRGIYSHMMGFLGGASWSILVANICQLFPSHSSSMLISKFFLLYSSWNWELPIILKDSEDLYDVDEEEMKREGAAMHIVTPIRPASNSSSNVSLSTRSILINEFKRATSIISLISWNISSWMTLFELGDFFAEYPLYVRLSISANTADDHRRWEGWVKSRIPGLTRMLEAHPMVLLCHPRVEVWKEEESFTPTSVVYVGLVLRDLWSEPPIYVAMGFMDSVYEWKEKSEDMGLMISWVQNSMFRG